MHGRALVGDGEGAVCACYVPEGTDLRLDEVATVHRLRDDLRTLPWENGGSAGDPVELVRRMLRCDFTISSGGLRFRETLVNCNRAVGAGGF